MDAGDNELIKCIKEGDLKAFEKVFPKIRNYHPIHD